VIVRENPPHDKTKLLQTNGTPERPWLPGNTQLNTTGSDAKMHWTNRIHVLVACVERDNTLRVDENLVECHRIGTFVRVVMSGEEHIHRVLYQEWLELPT
jgi:hypothetical protein